MTPEVAQFSNRGMNQDISVSKATNEFAFENYNIRITAVNDNTLLSITNEKLPKNLEVQIAEYRVPNKITYVYDTTSLFYGFKAQVPVESDVTINYKFKNGITGTKTINKGSIQSSTLMIPSNTDVSEYTVSPDVDSRMHYYTDIPTYSIITDSIKGTYLGHAVLNEYLVLFTTHNNDVYKDKIYVLKYENDSFTGKLKYEGNLNFSLKHPIETLPYYESELVQKVYWVDGLNQPRVINIVADDIVERLDTQFDFNPTITKFPEVTITKEYSGVGLFPAGVIQYFVSYYNKYGAETGIVWSSDLQYVTEYNRAAGPDETVVCNFKIDISNVDTTYDYARVYSMQRTSLNTTPICRIVSDVNINNSDSITIIDTNTNTETIDPTQLLFLGGDNFIVSTLTQKDDVLFLGDLEVKNIVIDDKIKNLFTFDGNEYDSPYIEFTQTGVSPDAYFKSPVRTFKGGEWYRFGIQFQSNDTKWTTPIFLGDKQCLIYPSNYDFYGYNYINTSTIKFNKPTNFDSIVTECNYSNYRIVMVETNTNNRKVLAQGMLNPTVFNINNRVLNNGPFAVGSWISRPINGKASYQHLSSLGNGYIKDGEDEIWENLPSCEIQNVIKEAPVVNIENAGYIIQFGVDLNGYYEAYIWKVENIENVEIYQITESSIKSLVAKIENKHESSLEVIYNKILEFYNEYLPEASFGGLDLNNFTKYYEETFDITWNEGNVKDFAPIYDTLWASGNFIQDKNSNVLKVSNQYIYMARAYTYVTTSLSEKTAFKDKNGYYVDSSIVTLNSPDLENTKSVLETPNLKLNIIGIIPINNTFSDIIIETNSSSLKEGAGLVKSFLDTSTNKDLINDALYQDFGWDYDGTLNRGYTYNYYVYLWNKKGSITGQTSESYYEEGEDNKQFNIVNADLKHKVIANKKVSNFNKYFNTKEIDEYTVYPTVFDETEIVSKKLNNFEQDTYYQGNVDVVIPTTSNKYKVFWKDVYGKNVDGYTKLMQVDPVQIKFNKTQHAVFNLTKGNDNTYILPSLNKEEKWDFSTLYPGENSNTEFYWLKNKQYFQNTITSESVLTPEIPYLYLAEVLRDVDSKTLYGEISQDNLEKHIWIPISDATSITSSVKKFYGDTYYQRWECLNTTPSTEEDLNSVVDIVSFMVETHVNLEGRYDKNKDSLNILNARPDNFNKINPVYSQSNNYFTYNILDEKFNQNKYFNQVAFSLQKTPTSEIDTWCNISLASAFNLDGKYGKLNKLITVNDAVLAFQDKALSVINFNNRTAISTENGVPIEIANTGKVNGYSIISSSIGCQNKLSICEASSGVYFIDDLNKTMYGFNKEGLSNISSKGMSMWFKKNLTGEEKCFYDKLTNDVYITTDNDCLVYNEALDAFTSFMEYNHIHSLFNFEGKSILLDKNNYDGTIDPKLMFAGDYTKDYYIQYKINPEPLTDKTFTNIEFIADKLNNEDIDSIPSKKNLLYPFTEFEVWNEYQHGITNLTKGRTYPNFERKFRIWRADIPRDKSNGRDRIRNPWIYLKLSNSDLNSAKMAFHSFLVKYYK